MSAKSNWISLLALVVLVIALPYYVLHEEGRMKQAQAEMRQRSLQEAEVLYVRYCATCHGARGEGFGAKPALNNPALAGAEASLLQKTIAQGVHGTAMAAWHIQEGGALSDHQIEQLVDLIRTADWASVEAVAIASGFEVIHMPEQQNQGDSLAENEADPHRCVACHEEPLVHRGYFGLDCARCHSNVAWMPAFLTRHVFLLDHGGRGTVACTTCHVDNYFTHTCYGCHDHTPEQMQEVHAAQNITDFAACATCHPTGQPDEARLLIKTGAVPDNGSSSDPAVPVSTLTSSPH